MKIISKVLACLIFATLCVAQLDDVDVIQSEMSQSMEKFAVGQALVLLSQEPNFSLVAEKLVNVMNDRYGNEWVALIGTNLHTMIIGMKIVNSSRLLMEYKSTHVLLAQQQVETFDNHNSSNLYRVIERAKISPINKIATNNNSTFEKLTHITKQVLDLDYESCDQMTNSKNIKNWCYREMSEKLVDAINSNYTNGESPYSVTIGNNNRCFSETLGLNITEYHIFTLGDIYFELRKFVV